MGYRKLGWPDVVNNFLLRLTSTGQLPLVAFIVLLGFVVYRTPAKDIGDVWRILQLMVDRHSGLGYALAVGLSGGWVTHARYQRRRFSREFERIGEERNQAQQKHFNQKLRSSEK